MKIPSMGNLKPPPQCKLLQCSACKTSARRATRPRWSTARRTRTRQRRGSSTRDDAATSPRRAARQHWSATAAPPRAKPWGGAWKRGMRQSRHTAAPWAARQRSARRGAVRDDSAAPPRSAARNREDACGRCARDNAVTPPRRGPCDIAGAGRQGAVCDDSAAPPRRAALNGGEARR